MKFATIVTGALAAASSLVEVQAAPAEKRQSQTIPVTGVKNWSGVQPRLELRTLQRQNPDQFNLYLLGLRRMMSVRQDDPLSYYQIAGIHGRPYIPWDGVAPPRDAPAGGYGGGYCTHASNLFLTWHRPYLALFEQTLYTHVAAVADTFPPDRRQRYQDAARTFRIPYWDWAAPVCSDCLPYPRLVSQQYLTMDTPEAGIQSRPNPLFRYDFQGAPGNAFAYDPFATWQMTKRFPTGWNANDVSQNDRIAQAVANAAPNLRERLAKIFNNNVFSMISNSAWIASSGSADADSLESIHDTIHSMVGSSGHMHYLDYSAFDPIFFLHHAMVDRVWAMWSFRYQKDDYVTPMNSTASTYTFPVRTEMSNMTNLEPFHSDTRGTFWKSIDVKSTSTFGYTYPELINANQGTLTTAINTLYGIVNTGRRKRDLAALSKRDDGHHYHYIANVASQRFQMNGSYSVYVFMGEPSPEPKDWPIAQNLVGLHGVFANMPGKDSVKMASMDLLTTGSIPLTRTLLQKCDSGELKDLEPDTVTPYLEQNLNWRVAMYDGSIVDAGDVPDLSVSVVVSDVTPPASVDQRPVWGRFSAIPDATINKIGGHIEKFWHFDSSLSIGELVGRGFRGTSAVSTKW